MRRLGTTIGYLFFPIAAVLASLLVPADKLLLRLLIGIIISGSGVIAADAGFRPADLRTLFRRDRSQTTPESRAETAGWLMMAAFVSMIVSALLFSPSNNREREFTLPVVLMVGGMIVLWRSIHFARPDFEVVTVAGEAIQPQRSHLPFAMIGLLLLLFTAEAAGKALRLPGLQTTPLLLQAVTFYGGVAFLVLGMGGVRQLHLPRLPQLPRLPRLSLSKLHDLRLDDRRAEIAIVILIFLGALLVRAWNLETGLRASVDEALAIDGISHYRGGAIGLVGRPSVYITSLLMPQWQAVIIDLFGRSVTTLRLASAIIGALTVTAVYFLARDLFNNRQTGIVAALFLLSFPPHIHFSRIALLHIADPLFGTLAFWFLIRGFRFNRRLDWALAGAMLGFTQYFFEAGRLFYIPLAAIWLILTIGFRLVVPIRIPWRGVLVAVLTLIIVAMPIYYAIFSGSADANPRLSVSSGVDLLLAALPDGLTPEETTTLARRLLFPLTVYVHQRELAVFYGGDQPLMLVYVVPLFLMGMGYLLWRWRTFGGSLVVLWVLATAATNALLRDSAVYARWHVVFPALALVAAVALCSLVPMLWKRTANEVSSEGIRPGHGRRQSVTLIVMGLSIIIAVGQVVYYYRDHVPLFERQAREFKAYPDGYDMAIRAKDVPDFTDIYLIADPIPDINVPRIWVSFLTKSDPATLRHIPLATSDFTPDFIAALPVGRNFAFFIDSQARDQIALMTSAFGCPIETSPYAIDPPTKAYVLCFKEME